MTTAQTVHKKTLATLIAICAVLLAAVTVVFSHRIFTVDTVYYYTASTIAQSFIALVGFLGAVVVFKIQLDESATERLSAGIIESVRHYRGAAAITYSPAEMLSACKEIIADPANTVNRDLITKTYGTMEATARSKSEVRTTMINYVTVSFCNVAMALVILPFSPALADHWRWGGVLLAANVALSIYSLYEGYRVVRSILGYSVIEAPTISPVIALK